MKRREDGLDRAINAFHRPCVAGRAR